MDVFSSQDVYLNSAVADTAMPPRRILQHLGLARPIDEAVDRHFMGPSEQVHWRELLPVVLANNGYGWIYILDEEREHEEVQRDSLHALGKRYEVVHEEDFVLVGERSETQSYWHVFTAGQEYVTTAMRYGGERFPHDEALTLLKLTGSH